MKKYKNLYKALEAAYPEKKWFPWKFAKPHRGLWRDKKTVQEFLEYCKNELEINGNEDWYRISNKQLAKFGGLFVRTADNRRIGSWLQQSSGGLGKALNFAYPEKNWEMKKFSFTGKKSAQRY